MSDTEMQDVSKEPSATSEPPQTYALSSIISAHKSDVKALALAATSIVSAGRDETIRFWGKKGGEYVEKLQLPQPKGIVVNSLAYVNTDDGWRLFAGRKDGSIAMYSSGNTEPTQVYKEHENNVCCLHADEINGILMSGSWDTHVIVWPINDLTKPEFAALSLRGHTLSVWALSSFVDRKDYYLTASADKTIRLWHRDESIQTYKGHEDVVRALRVLSKDYFLSAGNDGLVCHWSVASGACLGKFRTKAAHEFIYSMSLTDEHVLTVGEEGALEFWTMSGDKENHLALASDSIIETPSSTAWDVKVLPSSDIAVAASDGRIYIFSKEVNRHAVSDIREAFDAAVVAKVTAQMARAEESNTVVIKVSLDDGPAKLELRYEKGTDPTKSAEKFISDNNLPVSYLNEVVDYICQNIPEARAARFGSTKLQPGQRQMVDGEECDHAFEVTLENGKVLKMPYNRGEDVDYAAQRFVEKHNLPVKFLPMLAQLIRNEIYSGGPSTTLPDFYDPFTGSGRYVPGAGNNSVGGSFADPLTGGGRYVPSANGSGSGSDGFSGDPLTGSGGYRTSDKHAAHATPLSSLPIDKKKPRGALVPMNEYFTFGVAGASQKAIAKLHEINDRQDALRLSDDQMSGLEELMTLQPSTHTSYQSGTVQSAFETAFQWAAADLAPVLDLLRIAMLHESLNTFFCSKARGLELINRLVAILVSEPEDVAVSVFLCRTISNSFKHEAGRVLFSSTELNTLAPLVVKQLNSSKSVLQLAAASALANWSLALLQQSQECAQLGPREDVLRAVISSIENVSSFGGMSEDALTRLLQAIVTLMWGDSNVIKLAKNRNMATLAARLKDAAVSESAKNVARDIVEMTYAV